MDDFTEEELEEARRALASLLHKCRKSREKLKEDSWQWKLMEDNIRAVEVVLPMLQPEGVVDFSGDDLEAAFRALSSTLDRTEKIREKLKQGTSQWTLNKNRIRALTIALALLSQSLKEKEPV
jgi:ABC-type antimicrobial peptide transport system ATPase subunit